MLPTRSSPDVAALVRRATPSSLLSLRLPQVFNHELKLCYSLAECATLKASTVAAATVTANIPVVMALINPTDIVAGWDSQLLDGAFCWGTSLDHLMANGAHTLVTAEDLCCNPLLGTSGRAIFDTIVAHDLFLQKHGRKVYDAILTHVTRVLTLFDAASMATPDQFAVGTSYLYDIGKAVMTDMSPLVGKGVYNYKDEESIRSTIFLYTKLNRQQQLSCAYMADQTTQTCVATGGFTKGTMDTARFLADNKLLPPYTKNHSVTQAYIDSTYVRKAPTLLPGVTLASLRARGPGPETVVPSPAATRCSSRQVLAATAATFGDGHAPGGVYLDNMDCGWAIPGPSAGKVLALSFSLFSCEVEMDYLDIYAGSDATGALLGHFTGRMSRRVAAFGGSIPSVRSTTGMFVAWKTDNIMSHSWISPSEDGFVASFDPDTAGCSNDAQCGAGVAVAAGTCDISTGLCVCSPGWGGSDCSYDSCFGTVHLTRNGTLRSQAPGRTTSRNNVRCVWELDTATKDRAASLRFERFDLEDKFDKLRVYSYNVANDRTLLREFSGSAYAQGLVVRAPGRRLTVEFSSDAIHMSNGFQITFESKDQNKDCEVDADCSSSGVCNSKLKICNCAVGFTGSQCECGPGLCPHLGTATYAPVVISANPSVISPKGGVVSIIGNSFLPGIIAVTIDEKICGMPVFKSSTLIECVMRPGVGGPLRVVVTCQGVPSAPRKIVSYLQPHIFDTSRSWVADGSALRVEGSFFVAGSTKCRVDGYFESMATYIDDEHIICHTQYSAEALGTDRFGSLKSLEISNDGGDRWVSGVTLDTPIEWAGGALLPVPARTIGYPKEVVIGGMVETDIDSDPVRAQQAINELSISYHLAASAVNKAALFPGNTQLRVEILLVDPGVSGTSKTVTEVATAFAQKGENLSTNVIGMTRFQWSSNAVPAARLATPFHLPVISYNSWSSVLDNSSEFPYFMRVGPSNSDISKVCGVFIRSMAWNRIAVVTDDDAFANDFGMQVANDVKEHGGTVVYRGTFRTMPTSSVVNKLGREHLEGVKRISPLLLRAREKGARVIFVVAKGNTGKTALLSALKATGFFGEGFAIMVGEGMPPLAGSDSDEVNGVVYLTTHEANDCSVDTCPSKVCEPNCVSDPYLVNQAYDAVLTLASAIAPLFRDGGRRYLEGALDSRLAAMASIRATRLSSNIAASGFLEFEGPATTNREKWNFGYVHECRRRR